MAFPHPQSREDHDRNEDEPGLEGVVGKFVKRTVNIADYRNGKDDVNPAKNRTRDGGARLALSRNVCCIGCCGHDVTPWI